MVYDDSKDHAFLHDPEELRYLAAVNTSPRGLAKRWLRQVLRAFGGSGEPVRHDYEADRSFTVPDGTHEETSTDSDGNQTTRTVQDYSTITVRLYFKRGYIRVSAPPHSTSGWLFHMTESYQITSEDESNVWSAGFSFDLYYNDGYGHAIKPRTGESFDPKNEVTYLEAEEVGYSRRIDDFTLNPHTRLATIIEENGEKLERDLKRRRTVSRGVHLPFKKLRSFAYHWHSFLVKHAQFVMDYRQELAERRAENERLVSSAFWLFVYENDTITRPQLTRYFESCEHGPLRSLPEDHAAGLDFAFGRLAFVRSGPLAAFWCVFWHDVWHCNKELAIFEDNGDFLDPAHPGTIAYRPMPRPDLEAALTERGLHKLGSSAWLNVDILTLLYDTAGKLGEGGGVVPASQSEDTEQEIVSTELELQVAAEPVPEPDLENAVEKDAFWLES